MSCDGTAIALKAIALDRIGGKPSPEENIVAATLQVWGSPMNGALRQALVDRWLASPVSLLPVVALPFVRQRGAGPFAGLMTAVIIPIARP